MFELYVVTKVRVAKNVRINIVRMPLCVDARHRHSCMKKTILEVDVKMTTGNQNNNEQIHMTAAMTLALTQFCKFLHSGSLATLLEFYFFFHTLM